MKGAMMLLLQIMRQKESHSPDKKRVKSYFHLFYLASLCWCRPPLWPLMPNNNRRGKCVNERCHYCPLSPRRLASAGHYQMSQSQPRAPGAVGSHCPREMSRDTRDIRHEPRDTCHKRQFIPTSLTGPHIIGVDTRGEMNAPNTSKGR